MGMHPPESIPSLPSFEENLELLLEIATSFAIYFLTSFKCQICVLVALNFDPILVLLFLVALKDILVESEVNIFIC